MEIIPAPVYVLKGRRSLAYMEISELGMRLLVLLALACECSLFFLNIVPTSFLDYCNYLTKYPSSLLAIVGAMGALLISGWNQREVSYLFGIPILLFVLMCSALSIVSSVGYDVSLHSVLAISLPFICVPLMYFALHGVVENDRAYDFFVNAYIAFAAIFAALCILQSLGLNLMNESYQYTSLRGERLRIIVSGDFVAFGAVLALGKTFSAQKHRLRYFVLFAILFFELCWVAQTRMLIVAVVVAAAFGFVESGRNRIIKVLLVALAIVLVTPGISDQIMTMLVPGASDASGTARLNAYSYYLGHTADLGLFGLGYIPASSSQSQILDMITIAGMERGDITDIGIIGYFARYGFCGLIVLAIGLFFLFRRIRLVSKSGLFLSTHLEVWMSLVFFIATSPTMAITDPQRIFYLPVLALLLEFALRPKARR